MSSLISTKQISVNISPAYKCWRLVYNATNKKVLFFIEGVGALQTIQNIFCSSPTDGSTSGFVTSAAGKEECEDQIKSLGLTVAPYGEHHTTKIG